jgi:hypothetical protein
MKTKIIGIFVCMLLIATALPAVGTVKNPSDGENPIDEPLEDGDWITFGGSEYDFGSCVQQTDDGGYIIAAETESYGAGGNDVWLIKTDSDGNEQWSKTFGGADDDWSSFVRQTYDSGYIITGVTTSFGPGLQDAWLIKTDADGNEQWSKTFGGASNDGGWIVRPTIDDGYIILGLTDSFGENWDYWLIKTDSDGNEEWNKTYGGGGTEWCYGLQPVDDGYIIVGYVVPTRMFDKIYCWVVKTDLNGNEEWNKIIKETRHVGALCVRQTSDDGYIISGETVTFGLAIVGTFFFYFGGDMWLVKIDADGNMEWEKSFGGKILEDCGRSIELTDDGGYIIAGFTKGFGSSIKQMQMAPPLSKVWVVKTDSDGNKISEQEYSRGLCWWIEKTNDGGYIATGCTKPHGKGDVFLLKID